MSTYILLELKLESGESSSGIGQAQNEVGERREAKQESKDQMSGQTSSQGSSQKGLTGSKLSFSELSNQSDQGGGQEGDWRQGREVTVGQDESSQSTLSGSAGQEVEALFLLGFSSHDGTVKKDREQDVRDEGGGERFDEEAEDGGQKDGAEGREDSKSKLEDSQPGKGVQNLGGRNFNGRLKIRVSQ